MPVQAGNDGVQVWQQCPLAADIDDGALLATWGDRVAGGKGCGRYGPTRPQTLASRSVGAKVLDSSAPGTPIPGQAGDAGAVRDVVSRRGSRGDAGQRALVQMAAVGKGDGADGAAGFDEQYRQPAARSGIMR